MGQFDFLKAEFNEIYKHISHAEKIALSDPRGSCFYARLAVETTLKWMYKYEACLEQPYADNLSALIHEPSFKNLVGRDIFTKLSIIKNNGNKAAHDHKAVVARDAIVTLSQFHHFAYWLVRTYARGDKPQSNIHFDASKLEKTQNVKTSTLKTLQQVTEKFVAFEKERKEAEAERIALAESRKELEKELELLRAQVQTQKQLNQTVPDNHDYDEATTRELFIDQLLHEAGWELSEDDDREFPITGMPTKSGKGKVDYVLWGDDGMPLGLVEAKRSKKDPATGQHQAKLYADCLEKKYGVRPVIFFTNGNQHYIWDDLTSAPRETQGFYKKDELELIHKRRSTLKKLSDVKINNKIVERPYQHRAIKRVGEWFEKHNQRRALLVMATGTGKTRTAIALTEQFLKANRAKRVLFLADRVALVNQAKRAFNEHLRDTSLVNLLEDKNMDGRICLSTYPTMMSLIDSVNDKQRTFGVGHFDLIIVDEAHRSVYKKYKAIFEYFDAPLIGLTATPKEEIHKDTYRLFELENGQPTDKYDLEEAIKDGYLVPYKAYSVPLKFQRQGITYEELSEDDKEMWEETEWDEPDRDHVSSQDLNNWLFNRDTTNKIIHHVMQNGLKINEGNTLGKTIIFAKNHKHAKHLLEVFDKNYPEYKGEFARIIDYQTSHVQSLIDSFSEPQSMPQIAISVDMLDTGIDIPSILNLVFCKPLKSPTKFHQMIGRGTRLCENLFGHGNDKSSFLIFDFCENFEYFKENPKQSVGTSSSSLNEKIFKAKIELLKYLEDSSYKNLIRNSLHATVNSLNIDNFTIRPHRQIVEKYSDKAIWENLVKEDYQKLKSTIALLPQTGKEKDINAKKFDYLIFTIMNAVLTSKPANKSIEKVCEISRRLLQKSNVNQVQKEVSFITETSSKSYYQNLSIEKLEEIRVRLRGLLKLLDPNEQVSVYVDFEDSIGESAEVGFVDTVSVEEQEAFKQKVLFFLKDKKDHLTIHKLRKGENLTRLDIKELEKTFQENGFDIDELKNLNAEGSVGIFIRSILGMEREAVAREFSTLVQTFNMSANQIQFINLIVDSLTENGIINPRSLFESPFTDIHSQGVTALFSDGIDKLLIDTINNINDNAKAI